MIAAWMVYAIVVSAALALAALAVEQGLALYRRPTRLFWLAAIVTGFWLPVLSLVGWLKPAGGRSALGSLVAARLPPLWVESAHAYTRVEAWAQALDAVLVAGWVIASVAILWTLAATFRRLRREGRAWTSEDLDGVPVLVSPDLGPALFGVLSGSIVVPGWFRELPVDTRHLALLHEREHLRARDTGLLLAGLVAVALVPWNPVMWWMLRRFRAAVELDCDDRVLASGANRLAYASVLLDVSERSAPLGLAKPALAEPKSLLTRRVTAMLRNQMRTRWPWAGVYGLTAMALLALACETPAPDQAASGLSGVPNAALAGALPESTPGLELPERVSFPPPEYPRLLLQAGIEGTVLTAFVVGTDGRAEPGTIQILESSNAPFEAPVRDAIQKAVFRPGRLHGEPVRVQIQLPIRFVIPK
jgi:bla regulator protein BlaR1